MLRQSGEEDEAVVYDVLGRQWRDMAHRQEVMSAGVPDDPQ
jgi:hypothetical protein